MTIRRRIIARRRMKSTRPRLERAITVGVELRRRRGPWRLKDSLAELAELARSARAIVVGTVSQRIDRPTQVYLGKGKLEELKQLIYAKRASTVICDDELTPTQQRNLENALGESVKVIDRDGADSRRFRTAGAHQGRTLAGGAGAARIPAAEACRAVDTP